MFDSWRREQYIPRRTYYEGGEATVLVKRLLSTPGTVGIDFETSVDPAHQRKAYVLSVAHDCGASVVCRLGTPEIELREMFAPVVAQDPLLDDVVLVAHAADFETTVLLRYGVAVDVECTMLAAQCLERVAVPHGMPQPVSFALAALVERHLGRFRDKTIRDRDWSQADALDEEGAAYGQADAEDCLALWHLLRRRLADEGLLPGYRILQQSVLPSAAMTLRGLTLDADAHALLCRTLSSEAADLQAKLDRISAGAVRNHGSSLQVGTWIVETVLDLQQLTPPEPPPVERVRAWLRRRCGGLRPDRGGEVAARELPNSLVQLLGASLDDALVAAVEDGWLRDDASWDDLLALLEADSGSPVLREDDAAAWDAYETEREVHEATMAALRERGLEHRKRLLAAFDMRMRARTGHGWRWTATGRLQVDKGAMLRKPDLLRPHWPDLANYLEARAGWVKARKLIDAFGPRLRDHRDDDGRVRGQYHTAAAVTGRQSCSRPNLQQMPAEAPFRALFKAPPGRKFVICDYGQIELRLAAVVFQDEALLEVYRRGLDVHAETQRVTGVPTRRAAKAINFGIIYGAGAGGLSSAIGISVDEAVVFLTRFLAQYTGIARARAEAAESGVHGRQIDIRPASRVLIDPAIDVAPTVLINYPIQGGAARVQMRALRLIHDALPAGAELVASIHDEVIVEADENAAEAAAEVVQREMRRALLEIYPEAGEMRAADLAEAKIVSSWAEK